jgi:ADP-ribose pyrophosphatase
MDDTNQFEIVAETPYVRLVKRGHWAYAQRTRTSGVVGIVAVTSEGELVLVEQYRPPIGGPVIELPAGLVGDVEGEEDETFEAAAHRELFEETGYRADRMERVLEGVSSGGLCDEVVTLFLARGIRKVGEGGGDAAEDIVVHTVPLDRLASWLNERQAGGAAVDFRVYVGLYLGARGQADGDAVA